MSKARYEILPDDRTYYGEIPGFDGVYANADTLEACRDELEEALEGWILLRVSLHYPLPPGRNFKLSQELGVSSQDVRIGDDTQGGDKPRPYHGRLR